MVNLREVSQLVEDGDLVAAERIMKDVPHEESHGLWFFELFGEILLGQDKVGEAAPWVLKLVQFYEKEDQEWFEEVGKHDPVYYPYYRLYLALYQFLTGDIDESMKGFEALLRERLYFLKDMFGNKTFTPLLASSEFQELIKPAAVYTLDEQITLKLIFDKTLIFVCGNLFLTCQKALLTLFPSELKDYDEFDDIDNIVESYREARKKKGEDPPSREIFSITPEQEFWAHCSNMQAWVDSGYDTSVISKAISFPIFIELVKHGVSQFELLLKEELLARLKHGGWKAVEYIMSCGYYKYLTQEDLFEFLLVFEEAEVMKEVASISKLEYTITRSVHFSRDDQCTRARKMVHFSFVDGHVTELELFFDEGRVPQEKILEVVKKLKAFPWLFEVAVYGYLGTMTACAQTLERKGLKVLEAPYYYHFREYDGPPWRVLEEF